MIDSKHVGTIDGFDINAVLVPDTDTSTDDYDCYTPIAQAKLKELAE